MPVLTAFLEYENVNIDLRGGGLSTYFLARKSTLCCVVENPQLLSAGFLVLVQN